MKFMKLNRMALLCWAYCALVLVFAFMYFIVYRTDSRVAWYTEMHNQSENLVLEIQKMFNIK